MKVLISGTYSKKESETLASMADVFGFEPIVIVPNDKPETWKNRYNVLVNEAGCIFSYYNKNESVSTEFGTEERMAKCLKKPVYRLDEIKDKIVQNAIGKEVQWDELDDCCNDVPEFMFHEAIFINAANDAAESMRRNCDTIEEAINRAKNPFNYD